MSHPPPLPWDIVETLPTTDRTLLDDWQERVETAGDDRALARALIGRSLTRYWSVQEGTTTETWAEVARSRRDDLARAGELSRDEPRDGRTGPDDLRAEVLLGHLYALWGPDALAHREALIADAIGLERVDDPDLRRRIVEWVVIDRFDHGDLQGVVDTMQAYETDAYEGGGSPMVERRLELWRSNLAMLTGHIDDAVAANRRAISSTAGDAGSPFSFQNVAIVTAIERFFRRGLADLVEPIRSIRASSPRVGVNWDAGLAFSLAEVGALDEARQLFESVATDGFTLVPRDLNWLVTMQLLGLTALHLDDRARSDELHDLLVPFGHLDATHGSGYASYGPVGRVVASLAAATGRTDDAARWFDLVLTTRSPGPWTTLTRLDRARACLPERPRADDVADVDLAVDELRGWGLDVRAAEAEHLATEIRRRSGSDRSATRHDGVWQLVHPSGTATVRDSTGLSLLVTLLERAGSTISAIELGGRADPGLPVTSAATTTLDAQARTAYRTRLGQLEQRRRPLTGQEHDEVAALRRELAGAVFTRASEPEIERARVRVTKAVRRALDAVAAASPSLGEHLRLSVTTGRECAYLPADGVSWIVRRL